METIEQKIMAFLEKEKFGGYSPTDIAKAIGLRDSSYISRPLKGLVEKGWAYRMEYSDNPRVVYGMRKDTADD